MDFSRPYTEVFIKDKPPVNFSLPSLIAQIKSPIPASLLIVFDTLLFNNKEPNIPVTDVRKAIFIPPRNSGILVLISLGLKTNNPINIPKNVPNNPS